MLTKKPELIVELRGTALLLVHTVATDVLQKTKICIWIDFLDNWREKSVKNISNSSAI